MYKNMLISKLSREGSCKIVIRYDVLTSGVNDNHIIYNIYIIIIIIIQPLGRSGQRPEFSQATSMALVRCILGKFLGVACHCFPPLFRCSHFSPPGASTVRHDVRDPSGGSGNCGRECCPVILPK